MKARTMFFTTVFITETNFIWSVRRLNKSVTKSVKEDFNLTLFIICIFTLGIHVLLVLFSFPINKVINEVLGLNFQLNFLFLSPEDWLLCIIFSIPGLLGIEIIKYFARKKRMIFIWWGLLCRYRWRWATYMHNIQTKFSTILH